MYLVKTAKVSINKLNFGFSDQKKTEQKHTL